MGEILHQYRFVAVVALLGVAAVLAMEKGRLPLALRGIRKVMGRDAGSGETPRGDERRGVPAWRRALAFALVLAAFAIAVL